MIIDAHTHIYPDLIAGQTIRGMEKTIYNSQGFHAQAASSGKATDLTKSCEESGIDLAIVCPVATNTRQPAKLNKIGREMNEHTDETRLFSFGAIHPDNEDYKEIIDEIVAADMKGIKIHPDYQKTEFDDEKYIRIMDYAAEKDLVIVTHAGEDIGLPDKVHCTPDMILNVWKHIQPEKLVLAHMAGWKLWDEVEEKIVGMPVYMDSAICMNKTTPIHLEQEQFARIVKNHGADKILFGTDSPWYDQGIALKDLRESGLTSEELELVLGENAKRLLNI